MKGEKSLNYSRWKNVRFYSRKHAMYEELISDEIKHK